MLVIKTSRFGPYAALAFSLFLLLSVNVGSILTGKGIVDNALDYLGMNLFCGFFVYVYLHMVRRGAEPSEFRADRNGVSYHTSAKISLFTFRLLEKPRKMFLPWEKVVRIWCAYSPGGDDKAVFLEIEKSQFDDLEEPSGGLKYEYDGNALFKEIKEYRLMFRLGSKSELISGLLSDLKNGIDSPAGEEIVVR